MHAEDKDALHNGTKGIVYNLLDDFSTFSIDHRTGSLYLKSELDFETQMMYNLTVIVFYTRPVLNRKNNITCTM